MNRHSFLGLVLAIVCSVAGCRSWPIVDAMDGRRSQVEYYDPAQRLYGPLAATPITMQPPDLRQFNLDMQVRAPGVPILLVLSDDVTWSELVPILGADGVLHAQRSTGSTSLVVPPVVSVTGEYGAPLVRTIERAYFWKSRAAPDNSLAYRYCVVPPGWSPGFRLEQKILPTPESAAGRYRIRINWIELRGPGAGANGPDIRCDAGTRPIQGGPYAAAEARRLDALARNLEISKTGIAVIGVMLIGGIALIAGS